MTKEQFNALISLGFTGDQILAIANTGKTAQTGGEDLRSKTVQTEQTQSQTQPESQPQPEQQENETVKMLKEMLGLMKSNNINSLTMNQTPEKSGADILADIIDPE